MTHAADSKSSPLLALMGRIPSGIYLLTARHGEQETGMLASWVMQAGFDPPAVSVAVGRGRYLADWLAEGCPFALCIVAEHQKPLLKHFGRGFAPGEPAFEGLAIDRDAHGVPVVVEGTLGYLSCKARSHADSGDHRIFVADVLDGRLLSDERAMVHHRKTGAHY
ncbi:MAG: flavin reductase family protein [Planctomycetia bacterium]|nr:flavin reductase family protein [Planctomycetia bacterium]